MIFRYITTLLIVIGLTASLAYGESVPRRSQALQFYQEGLFHETGTGNLEMALSIYASILKDYKDFRDIQAVVIYRLGLIHIKLGDNTKALTLFRSITKNYKDQKTVYTQAKLKLKNLKKIPLPKKSSNTAHKKKPLFQPEKKTITATPSTPTPTDPETNVTTAQSKKSISSFGLGLNNIGLHCKLQLSDNLQLESRFQFQPWDKRFLISARGTYYLPTTNSDKTNLPYFGIEWGILSNPLKTWDYKIGSYVGYEWFLSNALRLGCDLGYYYQNAPQEKNSVVETSILLNTSLTYYF